MEFDTHRPKVIAAGVGVLRGLAITTAQEQQGHSYEQESDAKTKQSKKRKKYATKIKAGAVRLVLMEQGERLCSLSCQARGNQAWEGCVFR